LINRRIDKIELVSEQENLFKSANIGFRLQNHNFLFIDDLSKIYWMTTTFRSLANIFEELIS
jgi:hypothetical protein